jgi:hypothetical protein
MLVAKCGQHVDAINCGWIVETDDAINMLGGYPLVSGFDVRDSLNGQVPIPYRRELVPDPV